MATALHRPGLIRSALAAALLVVAAVAPRAAHSAMAVYDGANHEANLKDLAEAIKTVKELQNIYGTAQQMRSVLGAAGSSPAGALGFGGGISSTLTGMQCLFPEMSSWMIPRSITPNFGSVCSSRRFINDMFMLPDPNDPQQRGRVGQINRVTVLKQRETVYREAAMNGLALAYQQKHDVPQSTQRIAAIAAEAANAADIHSDLQVTNKLLLVIAEQLVAMRMISAGQLEATTAEQLQTVPVNFYDQASAPQPPANQGAFGE